MGMHLKIFELLPKTDCQKCGRDTCLVFAAELAERQTCLEACPDITDEAASVLRRIMAVEREMISLLWGMISGIRKSDVKGALLLFREVFIVFPVRIVSLLLFTLPLSFPFLIVALWFYMI